MTSDKNGPGRTATPALEEDLDATRDRKEVMAEKAAADSPSTEPSDDGQDTPATPPVPAPPAPETARKSAAAKPSTPEQAAPAKPAEKSAASSTGEAGASVPTTGGIWRSAYEAGRVDTGAESAEQAGPAKQAEPAKQADSAKQAPTKGQNDEGAPPSLVSAIGRVSGKSEAATPQSTAGQEPKTEAKSWNRVQAPAAAGTGAVVGTAAAAGSAGSSGAGEAAEGVKSGAMKAAQAALDAARSAARKVSSIMPDDEQKTAPQAAQQGEANSRPDMHYTAGGVRGTATSTDAASANGAQARQNAAQPVSDPTPEAQRAAPAGPRRVRLAISRVDPWSVMKLAFLLAVAVAIMTVVATAVFWSVLNSLGVFTTIQAFVADAVGPQSDVNLTQFVEFPRVISLATLISICNIVLLTAIATIMAFLYNITAALVGGVHMTLTDD